MKRPAYGSKRGAASVLMILLLVLLVFFGVLSLVTAATDLRLADRRARANQAYYLADSQAARLLARIGEACRQDEFLQAGPDRRLELLAALLEKEPHVRSYDIASEGGRLQVKAVTGLDGRDEQGIDLELEIVAESGDPLSCRIIARRWSWWKKPFDYQAEPGGVWEG